MSSHDAVIAIQFGSTGEWHMLCSSKKGMSALQLQRNLGLGSYNTAWFLCHRIRLAMQGKPVETKMSGIVEADETYIGGKPRVKNSGKRGRGTKKTPVMVLVQRDGGSVCTPLPNVTGATLRGELVRNVEVTATLMTDDLNSYNRPGKLFAEHESVNHTAKEYVRVRADGLVVHTNTAESFFALMKRGHYGVYHSMSKKHLHRYCSEFSFHWASGQVRSGSIISTLPMSTRWDAALRWRTLHFPIGHRGCRASRTRSARGSRSFTMAMVACER